MDPRTDPNYCHRVTANAGKTGEAWLRAFQDNDKTIPTMLTTSQKLSTGVDARNIRHIVLMRPIRSMIEFKQIIGRGTRLFEGKDFFAIWDFVKAHENFQDQEWDGEPLEPPPPRPVSGPVGDPPGGYEGSGEDTGGGGGGEQPEKIVIKLADGKARQIQYIATTTYWMDGKQLTAAQFLERLFGDLKGLIADQDQFRETWSDPAPRERLLDQLADRGYDIGRLDDIRRLVDAVDSDLFDVLAYVLFTNPPKTRRDRADHVEAEGLDKENEELLAVLTAILKSYVTHGEGELATKKLEQYLVARYGSVGESKAHIGTIEDVRHAYAEMQKSLYSQ